MIYASGHTNSARSIRLLLVVAFLYRIMLINLLEADEDVVFNFSEIDILTIPFLAIFSPDMVPNSTNTPLFISVFSETQSLYFIKL